MIKKYSLILIIFLVVVPLLSAEESEIGLWELQSIGLTETVILNFQKNGTITTPQDRTQSPIPYDPNTQKFILPDLGLVRYSVSQGRMEVFLSNIDETHPFLISFLSAFDSGYFNEVEDQFIKKFTEAMIEIFQTTPFMAGDRVTRE
ncbi:MAG: hypothetical protein ACLFST_15700 [Spirochaetia bacterium]